MNKLFSGLGIKNAGKVIGSILTQEIGEWEKIKDISIEELENIDGIGSVIAKEIVNFFKNNKIIVENLERHFEMETKKSSGSGSLEGKVFCLSGSLEGGKAFWKSEIENNGGEVKSGISKNTHYLIAASGSGLKSEKARSLNIPILNTDELAELLNS